MVYRIPVRTGPSELVGVKVHARPADVDLALDKIRI